MQRYQNPGDSHMDSGVLKAEHHSLAENIWSNEELYNQALTFEQEGKLGQAFYFYKQVLNSDFIDTSYFQARKKVIDYLILNNFEKIQGERLPDYLETDSLSDEKLQLSDDILLLSTNEEKFDIGYMELLKFFIPASISNHGKTPDYEGTHLTHRQYLQFFAQLRKNNPGIMQALSHEISQRKISLIKILKILNSDGDPSCEKFLEDIQELGRDRFIIMMKECLSRFWIYEICDKKSLDAKIKELKKVGQLHRGFLDIVSLILLMRNKYPMPQVIFRLISLFTEEASGDPEQQQTQRLRLNFIQAFGFLLNSSSRCWDLDILRETLPWSDSLDFKVIVQAFIAHGINLNEEDKYGANLPRLKWLACMDEWSEFPIFQEFLTAFNLDRSITDQDRNWIEKLLITQPKEIIPYVFGNSESSLLALSKIARLRPEVLSLFSKQELQSRLDLLNKLHSTKLVSEQKALSDSDDECTGRRKLDHMTLNDISFLINLFRIKLGIKKISVEVTKKHWLKKEKSKLKYIGELRDGGFYTSPRDPNATPFNTYEVNPDTAAAFRRLQKRHQVHALRQPEEKKKVLTTPPSSPRLFLDVSFSRRSSRFESLELSKIVKKEPEEGESLDKKEEDDFCEEKDKDDSLIKAKEKILTGIFGRRGDNNISSASSSSRSSMSSVESTSSSSSSQSHGSFQPPKSRFGSGNS